MTSLYCCCGHFGFAIDIKKIIFFLKNYPKKVPAWCDFRWFSGSQNNNLKKNSNYFS
jgi:hypothetical protein